MQSNAARVGVGVAFVAVVVVLFVVLSGGDNSSDNGDATNTQAATSTDGNANAAPATNVIQVKDGAPVGGIKEINVTNGDTVSLKVLPEAGDTEVHVHGYEIEKAVDGTTPVSLSFKADIEGGFEIEVHSTDGDFQIADLTVQPG
jgi:FtsP/CotA-like multicopper oxidase with cupredoxin domain